MSLTIAGIEAELIRKFGPKLALVTMDETTQNGTNADIDPSIRRALVSLGVTLASPPAVTDADLATISGFAYEKLMDLASLDLLTTALSRLNSYDIAVDMDQQRLSQLREGFESAIKMFEDRLAKPYGQSTPATLVGSIKTSQRIPNDPYRPRGCVDWCVWPYPRDSGT